MHRRHTFCCSGNLPNPLTTVVKVMQRMYRANKLIGISCDYFNRDFAIFAFERTFRQPQPKIEQSSSLAKVLQRSGTLPRHRCILILHLGLKMVLRWPHVVLSMEQSRNKLMLSTYASRTIHIY